MNRLTALLLFCACFVLPAFAEVRLALVIDQTNYQHTSELSRVTLASSEADQVETALKDTGFKVTRHRDLTSTGLRDALDAFRLSLENAGPEAVGFLYYTGHGSQHPQTRNSYLLGTDARLRGASDLAAYGIALETQKDAFAATGVKAIIMVFDACRNVAARDGFKSGVKGFGWLEASADMLIAYSTDLDDVAEEGVYAPVLAEEIRRPGQTAETLFANVQRKVAEKTSRQQRPWFNPRLYNSVCLAGCKTALLPSDSVLSDQELDNVRGQVSAADDEQALKNAQLYFNQARTAERAGQDEDARRYYKLSCDNGNVRGCYNLGHSYQVGKGGPQNDGEAYRLFTHVCDNGEMSGCGKLGDLYRMGQGTKRDYAKSRQFYKQACEGGNSQSCSNLGAIYHFGDGVARDEVEARRLFKLACDDGYDPGCKNLKSLP